MQLFAQDLKNKDMYVHLNSVVHKRLRSRLTLLIILSDQKVFSVFKMVILIYLVIASTGGAKGTILPSLGADPIACFEKYIDSLLDLLIPGKTAGIKGRIVDLYGRPELLFFGPDGTLSH